MTESQIEKLKIGAGAMAELLRMFYDALLQQSFSPDQAIKLTGDYMKGLLS